MVDIKVSWSGTLLGHSTVIRWVFDRSTQVSAGVISDSAIVGVAEENGRALETYFREHQYRSLRSKLSE
jgi:hypothetical protein